MHNFCTLFDSNYLTRGLAMYESLNKQCAAFHLYILAFDDICFEMLKKSNLENITVIRLSEFENERLLAVKTSRSRGEYCWTCTSHVIRYVLDTYNLEEVTYLDADIYFFGDPSILLDEFKRSGSSILITEHRYAPEYDRSSTAGIYCVQFITIKADERGLAALQWWQDRCIEWCYNRVEDGKFGDQKYLDDWTTRFEGVHVLEHLGGSVAPWNIKEYSLSELGSRFKVDGYDLVLYHFHCLTIYTNGEYDLGSYHIPEQAVELIYRPYLRSISDAKERVREISPGFSRGEMEKYKNWTYLFRFIYRRMRGRYHVIR